MGFEFGFCCAKCHDEIAEEKNSSATSQEKHRVFSFCSCFATYFVDFEV